MKRKYFNLLFLCFILGMGQICSPRGIEVIKDMIDPGNKELLVVIDPGHGGFDPGKIGVNKVLEKDINLSISFKVKELLEQDNIKVIMTREDDNGLYHANDRNKKSVDMRKRVTIINESKASIAVSIHQNSFSQESSRGAQVFYHQNSDKGKILAEIIQEQLKETLQDGNHRIAKSNGSYYMLRNTTCPLVIVECGFLSNWREAKLLNDDQYQQKVALGIYTGILQYFNQPENNKYPLK
ncbi:MAG: N-acetylmuramoyl-L-alanine amidase CwlD [Anaerocolumna sp.]